MQIDIEHKDLPEDDSWHQRLPLPGNAFGVPNGYFDDLSERLISATHLHQITEADPMGGFTVPENYFNQLGSNIQSRIALEEVLGNNTEGFTIPQGYFDELSNNIQSRIALEEALGDATESFTVPQGYFDELSSNIHSRIAIEEAVNDTESFTVPQGYFESLSSQIEARIKVEELVKADDDSAFTVPAGYFEGLQSKIVARTTGVEQQEAKVVAMPARTQMGMVRKLVSTAAFKYASAACFAVIVGLTIYMSDSSLFKNHDNTYLHKELSGIPTNDIRTFLENHTDAMETERTVIADDTHFDEDTLKSALQDYVSVQ